MNKNRTTYSQRRRDYSPIEKKLLGSLMTLWIIASTFLPLLAYVRTGNAIILFSLIFLIFPITILVRDKEVFRKQARNRGYSRWRARSYESFTQFSMSDVFIPHPSTIRRNSVPLYIYISRSIKLIRTISIVLCITLIFIATVCLPSLEPFNYHLNASVAHDLIYNPYSSKNNSPVLSDPLQNNNQGYQWEINNSCQFTHGGYEIQTIREAHCFARNTNFSDFIYEVQMRVVMGSGGGIAFDINPTNGDSYYSFIINQDGTYSTYISLTHPSIALGGDTYSSQRFFSPAIHQGLNQTNLIAARVEGNTIKMYVNYHSVYLAEDVVRLQDNISCHCRIGVTATGLQDLTLVTFQNVKVWNLS